MFFYCALKTVALTGQLSDHKANMRLESQGQTKAKLGEVNKGNDYPKVQQRKGKGALNTLNKTTREGSSMPPERYQERVERSGLEVIIDSGVAIPPETRLIRSGKSTGLKDITVKLCKDAGGAYNKVANLLTKYKKHDLLMRVEEEQRGEQQKDSVNEGQGRGGMEREKTEKEKEKEKEQHNRPSLPSPPVSAVSPASPVASSSKKRGAKDESEDEDERPRKTAKTVGATREERGVGVIREQERRQKLERASKSTKQQTPKPQSTAPCQAKKRTSRQSEDLATTFSSRTGLVPVDANKCAFCTLDVCHDPSKLRRHIGNIHGPGEPNQFEPIIKLRQMTYNELIELLSARGLFPDIPSRELYICPNIRQNRDQATALCNTILVRRQLMQQVKDHDLPIFPFKLPPCPPLPFTSQKRNKHVPLVMQEAAFRRTLYMKRMIECEANGQAYSPDPELSALACRHTISTSWLEKAAWTPSGRKKPDIGEMRYEDTEGKEIESEDGASEKEAVGIPRTKAEIRFSFLMSSRAWYFPMAPENPQYCAQSPPELTYKSDFQEGKHKIRAMEGYGD
ncbi:hypothetical protein C8J56DRAFT_1088931 [Mycena floridula]|nr:hypothetical protein C8J56DRAFT_1088931 [Mycena floridula]